MTLATYAAAQVLKVVPRVRLSQAVGRVCDTAVPAQVSRAVASLYARAYRVNLDEAEGGEGPYASIDQFFTRRLKSGVRPISTESVVSPSDGKVEAFGPIDVASTVRAKGTDYRVGELVGDEQDAKRYAGGQFCVVYLSPADYHRVHSPVAGEVVQVRSMPGDLYPVNSIGEKYVPNLFVRNQRVAIVIDTPDLGRVTVVMVGAMIVGRITITALGGKDTAPGTYPVSPGKQVEKGDEIGIFHLGSTTVLFVEPGVAISHPIGAIRYGQALSGS